MNWPQIAQRAASQRHLAAVRRGLLVNMPAAVIGSFAIMTNNLPVPAYQQAMLRIFGDRWTVFGQAIADATLNILAILLAVSVSYFLAETGRPVAEGRVNRLAAPLVAFSALMALIQPFDVQGLVGIRYAWYGAGGIFLAIAASLAATELFLWLCSFRPLGIRYFSDAADPVISQAMAGLLPATVTIVAFAALKAGAAAAGIGDIRQFAGAALAALFGYLENPLAEMPLFLILAHLLWFFGLHGNNILGQVLPLIQLAGVQAGAAPPPEMLTKTFLDCFVLLGGAGSTAGLLVALLIAARRGNTVKIVKLSLLPGLFNINELVVFGLPIVLNPLYLIPFLLVPVALALVSYVAIAVGLVAPVGQAVNWTTPPVVGGYLATGSWSGAILQLFNIALAAAIYLPFVTLSEKQKILETKQALAGFLRELTAAPAARSSFLTRPDSIGNLARVLAHDLGKALAGHELFLEYQPQVGRDGRVTGVEALLRWQHKTYGRIPPQLTVAVAEEAGLIHRLGRWTLDAACRQLRDWKNVGLDGFQIAVNISVLQLQSDLLPGEIHRTLGTYGLKPADLCLEITETIALTNDRRTDALLAEIRAGGVAIAIDDFGMGHTSLYYIRNFPVDTLKIDGVLSRDVLTDRSCQEIVASISSLCNSLGIRTIVEYVENESQRDKLSQLGCAHYQGYLYSPPLAADEVAEYIRNHRSPPQ
ncbi:EAL domain-containing protein [Anaeroselena agilis]|uniref:EAL domain-containing protein n=1 Tax=Anaeroselena agilis TaxID=3063788 RepID=A0ABU3P1H4_9FIRM|nr:EAL domain-containing protein [Selenomonadales bacterium 4137-cl]